MTDTKLSEQVAYLCKDANNAQEFTDICSIEDNWNNLDKSSIKVGKDVLIFEGECPECMETIRSTHPKFCTSDMFYSLTCPHCHQTMGVHLEHTGYTCDMSLEPYDEDVHQRT